MIRLLQILLRKFKLMKEESKDLPGFGNFHFDGSCEYCIDELEAVILSYKKDNLPNNAEILSNLEKVLKETKDKVKKIPIIKSDNENLKFGENRWVTIAQTSKTTNGRIYPESVLNKMVEKFKVSVPKNRELATFKESGSNINLLNVAAKITDFRLKKSDFSKLQVKFQILDTMAGGDVTCTNSDCRKIFSLASVGGLGGKCSKCGSICS